MTKKASIGAALRSRMQSPEEMAPEPIKVDLAPTPPAGLESFNTRLPRELQKRLKVYAAAHEVKVQDIVRQALEVFLEE